MFPRSPMKPLISDWSRSILMRVLLQKDSGNMKVTKVATINTRTHMKNQITNGNEGREAGTPLIWVSAFPWGIEWEFIWLLI